MKKKVEDAKPWEHELRVKDESYSPMLIQETELHNRHNTRSITQEIHYPANGENLYHLEIETSVVPLHY